MTDTTQKSTKTPSGTKVIQCSCSHDFQDSRYGNNLRVHNACKNGSNISYRCTVCENKK